MKQATRVIWSVLIASIPAMVACLGLPSSLIPFGQAATPPPAVLARCDQNPIVLCLVSFGVKEPDRMLINLFVPTEVPNNLSVAVKYKDSTSAYSCATVPSPRTFVYCTGEQLPLGATISIEVRARQGTVVLASGDFVLNALELPTVSVSDSISSASTAPTLLIPQPSVMPLRTLTSSISGTPPTAAATLPSKTPSAATGYPNP